MAGNDNSETFRIIVESNAAKTAKDDEAELANLQKRFESTTGALKQHESALKRLQQGGVVNIQTARDLKTRIDEEKNALAALTTRINTAGTSFEKLTEAKKKDEEKNREALKSANELSDAVGGGLVAAILAAEGALAILTISFGKFVVESANLARSQNLARAAVTGSEEDARRLGTQVDALSLKIPMLRSKVNELAIDMRRGGLGGQILVDTLNASAQAASALDDAAGKKVQELVDRGKMSGRFQLGALETRNTGLPEFNDVAAALAKNMKTSLADAQSALLQGRVALGDGAKALRDAVEKKFAGLNLAKMLDVDVMKEKLHELFQTLTKDVNLEPLLNALKDFFSIFDQSTEAGQGIKKIVTVLGDGLITVASKGLPILKSFFEGLVLESIRLYNQILKLEIRFDEAFGDPDLLKNIDLITTAVEGGKLALEAFVVVLGILAVTTLLALSPLIILVAIIAGIGYALYKVGSAVSDALDAFEGFETKVVKALGSADTWRNVGADIVQGLLDPLLKFAQRGEEIGNKFKTGFKKALGINSPSTVFEGFGVNTIEGYQRGLDRKAPAVSSQLEDMTTPSASGGAGGASIVIQAGAIQVIIQVGDHKAAREIASDAGMLEAITRAVERGATAAGQKVAA